MNLLVEKEFNGVELKKLLDMQSLGVLKTDTENRTLAGVKVERYNVKQILNSLGWVEWYLDCMEILKKTERFIRQLNKNISGSFWKGCYIELHNIRQSESIDTYDRIVFVSRKNRLTLIYNMRGSGGKYLLYDIDKSQSQPICSGSNLKQVVEYINMNYT